MLCTVCSGVLWWDSLCYYMLFYVFCLLDNFSGQHKHNRIKYLLFMKLMFSKLLHNLSLQQLSIVSNHSFVAKDFVIVISCYFPFILYQFILNIYFSLSSLLFLILFLLTFQISVHGHITYFVNNMDINSPTGAERITHDFPLQPPKSDCPPPPPPHPSTALQTQHGANLHHCVLAIQIRFK